MSLGVYLGMDHSQLKVLAKVLDISANEFSNHGCSDFNLDNLGLTQDELVSFKRGYTEWMKTDDSQYEECGNFVQDWLVMQYLQELVKKEVERHCP
jgi:hypothetical protein